MGLSTTQTQISVPTLIAIVVAARKSGDRQLERSTLQELREAYGIRLSFARPVRSKGGDDAK